MAKKIIFMAMIVLLALGFACLFLKLASPVFNYVDILFLAMFCATFSVYQIIRYVELRKQIEYDYPAFLAQLYSNGLLTKNQVESVDKTFYKQHQRRYLSLKLVNLGLILLGFSIMITLLCVFFAKV